MGRSAAAVATTILLGCVAPAPPGDGGTTAEPSGTSAIGATLDATAGVASDAASEPGATSTGTVGGTADASAGADGPRFDVPPLDLPPHEIDACSPSDAQHVELDIVTPSGAFAANYAWWAWEFCCITDPWLVLSDAPALEVVDGQITTPHVLVFVPGMWQRSGPYVGPRDVYLQDVGAVGFTALLGGFVLSQPLDPSIPPDAATPDLVATFAVEGEGWTLSGSVTAPYCAAIEGPACPCE